MNAGLMGTAGAQALAPTALPTGGQLAAGQASIGGVQATAGNGVRLEVTQASQQAVLNWQSFNIGSQAQVNFVQPNASATVLNRVAAGNPSEIQGQLTANGQVFLVNPNGILFGAGAQVNTGGLTASTLDISDQNFMARDYRFVLGSGGEASSVVNQGRITAAQGGYIALLAPEVRNEGVLVATLGTVALGAGERITLQIQGDRLINMSVDSAALDTLVENRLAIRAAGGQVILSARAANSLLQSVVNNTGVIEATSLADLQGGAQAGAIRADAGQITNTGTLDASGTGAGQSGGSIALTAGFIGLGGTLQADGQLQGGSIAASAQGTLSLADTVSARGLAGQGGAVRYSAGGQIVESSGSRTDVSGATDGGTVRALADGGVLSSGSYRADGAQGAGGRIDISGSGVRLLSAEISATGQSQGGLVRVGGAFQGGAEADPAGAIPVERFVTRWGATPNLVNAGKTFVNDSSRIDVSARGAQGQGGTAVVWSDSETTQLGAIDARGAGQGGAIEISSKDMLRHTALENVQAGAGGSLLLDPKNLYIGTPVETSAWSYSALMGNGYGPANPSQGVKDGAAFGAAVALNADSRTLAVGTPGDMGAAGGPGPGYYASSGLGAVRLYRFTDSSYSGAALTSTVGSGYTGGKNVNVALAAGDLFGTSVALNATGDLLAVGAPGDLGTSANGISQGAAYLFRFGDAALSGGTQALKIGNVTAGAGALDLRGANGAKTGGLVDGDAFGTSVALNAAGDRLAVGATGDLGGGNANDGAYLRGAVYLLGIDQANYANSKVQTLLSAAPTAGRNVQVAGLADGSQFGQSVALDASGNLLAAGAIGDMGAGLDGLQRGAVYLYSFSGTPAFSGATLQGRIGSGYSGGKNVDAALEDGDTFGAAVALSAAGDLLAVGATGDQGRDNTGYYGAVRLYSFGTGTPFAGGALAGTIGKGYTGAGNYDVACLTDGGEGFGAAVAMNAAGTRLVIGAPADAGSSRAAELPDAGGAAYLFSRTGGTLALDGVIGSGIAAVGSKSVDVNTVAAAPGVEVGLQSTDNFGSAVAMNAAGTQIAVGVPGDSGFNSATPNAGAVQLFTFSDANYNGGVLKGTLGKGYTGGNNLDVALSGGERFGSALALSAAGDRLAVGAAGAGSVRFYSFGTGFTAAASRWTSPLTGVGASSVALDGAGTRLAVGNVASGSVKLFDTGTNAPSLLRTLGAAEVGALASGDAFGSAVALDSGGTALAVGASGTAGNTGAVHLLSFVDNSYASVTQRSVIGKARTAANDINLDLSAGDRFGASVAFNRSGTASRLAVGATGTNADSGAVYLFGFPGSLLAAGELRGIMGRGYNVNPGDVTSAGNVNVAALRSTSSTYGTGDNFGAAVAFNGAGDRLAVGASQDIGANKTPNLVPAPHYGAVYLFTAAAPSGAQPGLAGQIYTPGTTAVPVVSNTISAASITTVLNGGTAVILKADNDITVGSAISANRTSTGALTLQAGRSVQVNASIDTGNGNLTLIGNDKRANGVGNALRDAGNASIEMAAGTALNAGSGAVNIALRDGAGLTNNTSGNITLRDVTAHTITATNQGPSANSNIVLEGTLSASASSGTSITLAGQKLVNNRGATALAAGAGSRWLVWSADPTALAGNSTLGGLSYGFKQYNASYGATDVADATLNGLLFSQAPTLGITLTNASPVSKTYDGTNSVTAPVSYTTTGLVDNDTLAALTGASYDSANAGNAKTLSFAGPRTISNGAVAVYGYGQAALGNANIGQITPKALTATINAGSADKVYDGSTAATATLTITDGLVGGQTLAATGTGVFNSQNVASANSVTLTGTALANGTGLASNYTLAAGQTAQAAIAARTLTATATASSKVYDGSAAAAPVLTITAGLVNGESVSATGTGSFNSKDVLAANRVTVDAITLADGANGLASNYRIDAGQQAAASITAKALGAAVVAGSADKVYDGTTAASARLAITSGLVNGETLTATGASTFNSRNVADANRVTVGAVTLADGTGLASNYQLAGGQSAAAAITARTLTASASASSKQYDGGASAAPVLTITSGLVGGETVSATGTGSFNSKDVLTANTVTVNSVTLADGNNGLASNYRLDAGQQASASITARTLTASATATDKVYDGNTTGTPTLTIASGLVTGETVTATGTGSFNSKDVLTANTVTVNSVTLADGNNGLASNYRLDAGQQAAASITARTLTATATANDKVYDGTTTGAPTLAIASGLVNGETVTATGTGTFNSKDVLAATTVTVNSVGLADGNNGLASNYQLAAGQQATASITARALTASAAAADKVYDGNASAAPVLTITSGLVGGETVTATGTGSFNSKDVLSAHTVTVASVALADGNNGLASNYRLDAGQQASAAITARTLGGNVIAGSADKAYDGSTAASARLDIASGLVTGETVTATGTGSFNSKDVLAAHTVTVNSVTLADGHNGLASNYRLDAGQQASASITARALTATATATDKVYDGTATGAPTLAIASGLVAGETVTASGTGSFNSKDVLAANTVTVNSVTLADGNNGLASNYRLDAGQQASASITAKTLTATATATDKVYDGTATGAPTLAIASGLVNGETVTATGTGSFNSKDVLAANTVTVNSVTLADGNNGLASNYRLDAGQQAAASITARTLTASATATDKVYDGTVTGAPTLAIASGLVNGETVTATGTGTFNSKDVLTANTVTVNSVTLADGNNGRASNYRLDAGQQAAAAITARALTATATATDKVYDGTATGAPTLAIASGLVNGETVTATGTGSFNSKDVLAANTVTVNSVTLADGNNGRASNYRLDAGQQAAASITARALTATATATDKVYDGTATGAPTLAIASGLVNGETVTATGTGSFNSKDVLTANTVTVNSVTLADGSNGLASNYRLDAGQQAAASITARTLTATATATDKVYDGTATGAPTLAIASGLVAGETVTATGTGSFNSKDVLAAHTVTVNSVTLADGTNGRASNYRLAAGQQAAASITAKTLTATATATDKVYDGTATGNPNLTIASGLVAGETVTATGTGSFNSKDVLTAHTVTVDSVTLADGNNGLASNYRLDAGQQAAASITARALTATATATDKVYDGTTAGAPTLAIASGLVAGETVTATGTGSFNSKDVLAAHTVTVNSITLADGSNGLASNYRLDAGQQAAAAITTKTLTAPATATDKVYDGTTTGNPTLTIASGLVTGETVTATGTGSFNSKDVLTADTVTVNSVTLADGSNGLASNYRLDAGQQASASITARTLTARATATDKVYDGTATGNTTLTIASGLVAGETVTATGTGSFNSKNVLTANTVTVNSVTLADGNNGLASNYRLDAGQQAAASITARALTATATATDKVYDGTATGAPTLAIASGLVDGESVQATGTGTFNSKDVLAANTVTVNSVTLADGNNGLASNYRLDAGQQAAASITARTLTATATATDKVYDGTATGAPTLAIASGLVAGETVTATGTGSFNSKDVLTADTVTVNSVTLADGNNGLASNYRLDAGQQAAASITAKTLTATATATDKVYDGTATAAPTLAIASGLVNGENVTATGTGSFNSKDVLTANTVTVDSVTLADGHNGLASNYRLEAGQQAAAAITPRTLTASATAPDKVYDGSTAAAPALAITAGLVGSETLRALATGSFDSKDVATARQVTVHSAVLADGTGLASNYQLAAGQTVAARITPATVQAGLSGSVEKVYDAGTAATLTAANYTLTGVLGSEDVTLTPAPTASYDNRNAGAGKQVTASGVALGGSGAGNYQLASTTVSAAVGRITPARLVVSADDQSSLNGLPLPELTGVVSGLQGSDTAAQVLGSLSYATAATRVSAPGQYAITPSATLASPNYTLSVENGSFTVLRADTGGPESGRLLEAVEDSDPVKARVHLRELSAPRRLDIEVLVGGVRLEP
ncbi:YDG domain-containing protein [Comamonas antarctica]|uniref:YDG domain-containing protein n=1 Tax=Comamonas antarctica TaxID=2743470 RepID=UPI0028F05B25|nr:YDG domain-containing protein [Comamonas antarctica]